MSSHVSSDDTLVILRSGQRPTVLSMCRPVSPLTFSPLSESLMHIPSRCMQRRTQYNWTEHPLHLRSVLLLVQLPLPHFCVVPWSADPISNSNSGIWVDGGGREHGEANLLPFYTPAPARSKTLNVYLMDPHTEAGLMYPNLEDYLGNKKEGTCTLQYIPLEESHGNYYLEI